MLASRSRYFEPRFAALAHRGGHCAASESAFENTLRAFRAAADLGFGSFETDVHATADGVLVAFHDDVLDRVTDASGRLADLPWDAVRAAKVGGSEPIPTMAELLDALPQHRFNIDLKSPTALEPLVALLEATAAHDRVCVGSFSESTIRAFRRRTRGRVATAASPSEVAALALAPRVAGVLPFGGQAYQVPVRDERTGLSIVRAATVAAARRRGAAVHVWTINERSEMERLIDLGVTGLVSDDIETLKTVLVERGLWEDLT